MTMNGMARRMSARIESGGKRIAKIKEPRYTITKMIDNIEITRTFLFIKIVV